ncbi:hypothetical protein SMI01S_27290 [Sphingobacterium mizutaii NBRC 14946 = DSM 11724]|uniref:Divergent AAA domain n=2 Tax=Sphingobacterium mizutaii TaxID=1010 RepID=A0AAJ4XC56_9SPHI|nr:ATP-binding protein [Sphingobacterium mizutaii]GEM69123.1 hypothetical protein SMI01S_27290 [Sphingobacterium mizutaii NBRC 14946 = DSM 11724]SDL07661.1 Putative DNA-binding domain-containing protein [Sphingobacterium mizutaii]SNV51110.1 Divergent AAA domain [Sphingobacterium mizutaii]
MIKYKIEGSYYTIDGQEVIVNTQVFEDKCPIFARQNAVNSFLCLKEVILSNNVIDFESNFKIIIPSSTYRLKSRKGKIIHGRLPSKPQYTEIQLCYYLDDDEDYGYTIDFLGLIDSEIVDDVTLNLKNEYEYYIENNLETSSLERITSYSYDLYEHENIIDPNTFWFMQTTFDISITKNKFWWMSNEELEAYCLANINIYKKNNLEFDISIGENRNIEFKPSLYYNFNLGKLTLGTTYFVAKSICSFLNSDGGKLFVGVRDDKEIQGLEDFDFAVVPEGMDKKDFFRKNFDKAISYYFSKTVWPYINGEFEIIDGKTIFIVEVKPSGYPVFLLNKTKSNDNSLKIIKEFYVRAIASSRKIEEIEEIILYIFNRWGKSNR